MSDEELETSATVAVLQESRDNKLEQNQLQLDLSDWTDGTTDTHTQTDRHGMSVSQQEKSFYNLDRDYKVV